jgi:hypothetical protein
MASLDWRMVASMALGFAAGMAIKAGTQYQNRETIEVIRRNLVVSALISGGCLIVTLSAVRAFNLDSLGAAGVALVLGWGGVQLLSTMLNAIGEAGLSWLRVKLSPPTDKKD